MKICTKCKEEKELTEFYIQKGRKNRSSHCKNCFNKFCIKRWINRKIEAVKYKGNKCIDCKVEGNDYNYVIFDFHHINAVEKDFQWNKGRLKSWDKITNELDKCILLCSNCHRLRHLKER